MLSWILAYHMHDRAMAVSRHPVWADGKAVAQPNRVCVGSWLVPPRYCRADRAACPATGYWFSLISTHITPNNGD